MLYLSIQCMLGAKYSLKHLMFSGEDDFVLPLHLSIYLFIFVMFKSMVRYALFPCLTVVKNNKFYMQFLTVRCLLWYAMVCYSLSFTLDILLPFTESYNHRIIESLEL